MKKTAQAAVLATTMALTPWTVTFAAQGGDFLHGQRLYSLGDYAGALTAWQPLAQEGDARAQYSMAVLYLKGRGVPLDKAKAKEWASRAAEQGYRPGQKLLQKLQQTPKKAKTSAKQKPRKAKSQMTELERIEVAVGDLLQQIAGKVARNGDLQHGDLRAEKLTDAIQITVPDIVIQSADGGNFNIGTVVAHVRRHDQRFDDITLALPGNMRFRKADGAEGRITIAQRLAKLRWDRQLGTSTEFEFRLSKLVFLLEAGGEMGRIGEVLVQAAVVEDKGFWTGPMQMALSKVKLSNGGTSSLQLGQLSLVLDFRGLDLPAYSQNLAQAQSDNGGVAPLEQIMKLAKGVGLRAKIDKLAAQHPDQGEFQLDQAEYGLDLSSDDGTLLNLALDMRHHGLQGTGSAAPDGMAPRDLDIALALENLPSETVVNVGVAAVIEMTLLGKLSSGPKVFERLRQDLSDAATVLRLKRADISAREYKIAMSASLLADKTAKAGMVGGGDLRVLGLEKLLAALGPPGGDKASAGRSITPLAALIKNGRPVNGGKEILFSLAVRPNGQLTVNDQPLISLVPFKNEADQ